MANNKNKSKCIFCFFKDVPITEVEPSVENLIIYKSSFSFIMMNKYPYINGHLMVIPYRHIDDILLLNEQEKLDIFGNIELSVKILKECYNPSGFNIGINVGKVAGAGIDQHIHFHIVPRFEADHNFMTTLANTRIINFSIEQTYEELIKQLRR
ncbi:MAG: HIT family protein [bacterium]